MNLSEIVKIVCKRTGYPEDEARHLVAELVDVLVARLDEGKDVHVRKLGRFAWEKSKGRVYKDVHTGRKRKYPSGRKLRFTPSIRLRKRRVPKKRRRRLKWRNSELS